jgi:ferredoxin
MFHKHRLNTPQQPHSSDERLREAPVREGCTLVINPLLCDGHGICTLLAPDLITLDPWGYPRVLNELLTDTEIRAAKQALRACPKAALALRATTP